MRKLKLEMGGADRAAKIKDDYGSGFSPAQESREVHKNEEIVLWFQDSDELLLLEYKSSRGF